MRQWFAMNSKERGRLAFARQEADRVPTLELIISDAETRCSVILKPVERLMRIAGGKPCSWPYQEFRLQATA
jgi:hypothetical protein